MLKVLFENVRVSFHEESSKLFFCLPWSFSINSRSTFLCLPLASMQLAQPHFVPRVSHFVRFECQTWHCQPRMSSREFHFVVLEFNKHWCTQIDSCLRFLLQTMQSLKCSKQKLVCDRSKNSFASRRFIVFVVVGSVSCFVVVSLIFCVFGPA
jgi:hypothetical protein